jgi:hypothetical protein
MFEGVIATSYNEGDKFFIDPMKLLPLSRFLPQPKYDLELTVALLISSVIFARHSWLWNNCR